MPANTVVVWQQQQGDGSYDIYARRYNAPAPR